MQVPIIHKLSNGEEVDTMEGYPVPLNSTTEPALRILLDMMKKSSKEEAAKETA